MGRTYSGMRTGVRQGFQQLANSNPEGAYYDTLKTLAAIDAMGAGTAKDLAEAAIQQDVMKARGGLHDVVSAPGAKLPAGMGADMYENFLRLNPAPNFQDIAAGNATYNRENYRDQAAAAQDPQERADLAALAANTTTPARFNVADGTEFSPYTGRSAPTAVGQSTIVQNLAKATADRYVGNSGLFLDTASGQVIDQRPFDMKGGNILNRGTGAASTVAGQQAPEIAGREMGLTDPIIQALEGFQHTNQWPDQVPYAPGRGPAPVSDAVRTEYSGRVAAASRAGAATEISGALNAQLDEVFSAPTTNADGTPFMDPFTHKQSITPDPARKAKFLRWWNQNKTAYPDINQGVAAYMEVEAKEGSGGMTQEDLEYTAKKYNITTDEVKRRLGDR